MDTQQQHALQNYSYKQEKKEAYFIWFRCQSVFSFENHEDFHYI